MLIFDRAVYDFYKIVLVVVVVVLVVVVVVVDFHCSCVICWGNRKQIVFLLLFSDGCLQS